MPGHSKWRDVAAEARLALGEQRVCAGTGGAERGREAGRPAAHHRHVEAPGRAHAPSRSRTSASRNSASSASDSTPLWRTWVTFR